MNRRGFDRFLMDRLLDERGSSGMQKEFLVDELKASVAADLESLLNARQGVSERLLAKYPEARRSVFSFGMVDFSAMSLLSEADRHAIRESVQEAIRRHERRLRQPHVTIEWSGRASEGLRLLISAQLVVNPVAQPVNFDALLEPMSMQYSVSANRSD